MIYLIGAGRLGRLILQRIEAVPLVRSHKDLKNERVIQFTERELKKHLKDADTIIHLAGSMDFSNPKRMHKANVELTRKIMFTLGVLVIFRLGAQIPAIGINVGFLADLMAKSAAFSSASAAGHGE